MNIALIFFVAPCNDRKGGRKMAVREWDTGIGRNAGYRGHTRNNDERDSCLLHGLNLFSSASKQERVAAF